MKFVKTDLSKGLKLPTAALKLGGFQPEEGAECHVLRDAVVVLKRRMNAFELIRAAWSLQQLSTKLCTRLALECGPCEGRGACDENGGCPYHPLDFALDMDIPEELREMAGIPKDAPVHVELLDDGEFTVSVNHDGPGLWDVPAPMMQGLLASGVCPASLEDLLESGEMVYGPETRRRTADD